MIALPERYKENMKELLGEEYKEYLGCFEQPSQTALRINTLKIRPEEFQTISPFDLQQIAWTAKGFYYDAKKASPSGHPHYFAGLYYIQEPSAMIPASILPVEPGDKVLDLCAAPGGKATELAAKLQGRGMLLANDISVSRAMALAKNLQKTGAVNTVVTAETPEKLAMHLPVFFDKILIDAPCSGEGMFRRDPKMVKDWEEKGPSYYAPIQRQILQRAWEMLKPGGKMVYSTCTFSPQEDEGMIQWFLDTYPDMRIAPVTRYPGFSEGRPDWIKAGDASLCHCIRIFPHRAQGEGHFAVLLEKKAAASAEEENLTDIQDSCSGGVFTERILNGGAGYTCDSRTDTEDRQSGEQGSSRSRGKKKNKKQKGNGNEKKTSDQNMGQVTEFMKDIHGLSGNIQIKKENAILLPVDWQALRGLRIITEGLLLGERKKQQFEPSVQLALAMTKDAYASCLDLPSEDERVLRYLKGETLQCEENYKGYVLLCTDGYPLGWCKGNGQGMLKNKYYAGWRLT